MATLREQLEARARTAIQAKEAAAKLQQQRAEEARKKEEEKVAPIPQPTPDIPKKQQTVAKLTIAEKIELARQQAKARAATMPDKQTLTETKEEVQVLLAKEVEAKESISAIKSISSDLERIDGFSPQEFVDKLGGLERALEAKAPGIANYLQDINTNLNQFPEITYLLNEDQLKLIVSGWFFLTNTAMAEVITRKGSRKKIEDEGMIEHLFGV